jgi:hypothetical protein
MATVTAAARVNALRGKLTGQRVEARADRSLVKVFFRGRVVKKMSGDDSAMRARADELVARA